MTRSVDLIKPPALRKGDLIGVCSPAWYIPQERLQAAVTFVEDLGYSLFLHPQTADQDASLAGTPEARAQALHDLFERPDIRAIFLSDGGYGCVQLLEHLDFNLIRQHPKIIIGYSDISLLLSAIQAQTGLVTFHGPSFYDLMQTFNTSVTLDSLFDTLSGACPRYLCSDTDVFPQTPVVVQEGSVSGPLHGGNHVRMKDLIGTPYLPNMDHALFFTESNRPSYPTLDGNLYHLRFSGALSNPQAILLGTMDLVHTDNPAPKYDHIRYNMPLEEMLAKHFPNVPAVYDLPFSHTRPDFLTFAMGIQYHLEASFHTGVTLEQLDSAVEI